MVLETTYLGTLNYHGNPVDHAVGDFNNDGLLDVLFSGPSWHPVEDQFDGVGRAIIALTATGVGSFSLNYRPDLGSPVLTRFAEVADFNGDGIDDAFFFNIGLDLPPFPGEANTLLFGGGGGPFVAPVPTFSDYSHGGDIGDVDNDGDIDIVVHNTTTVASSPEGSYLLLNNGAGNFTVDLAALSDLPADGDYISIALGDMNNDGNLDLIAGTNILDPSILAFGDGNGHFDISNAVNLPANGFGTGGITNEIHVTDINNDGIEDLIQTQTDGEFGNYYTGYNVQLLINDGFGNFTDETAARFFDGSYHHADYSWISDVEDVDFNNDGFTDYLFGFDFLQQAVSQDQGYHDSMPIVMMNDGTGRFDILTAGELGVPGVNLVAVDGGYIVYDTGFEGEHFGVTDVYFMQGNYGTGPGGVDPATVGAPGFNELYYLNNNPDVAAAVANGGFANGLQHYLGDGMAQGRAGFAPGAIVRGSQNDDQIWLREGGETAFGYGGNDLIYAFDGNDLVYGNQNDDLIYGNIGDDVLYGGQHNDVLYGGQNADVIYGNFQNDVIYGNFQDDVLYGGQDDDVLYGGQDQDTLYGNLGNDVLYGNLGDDNLYGGHGVNTLIGGQGADTFYVDGDDVVLDMSAEDTLIFL